MGKWQKSRVRYAQGETRAMAAERDAKAAAANTVDFSQESASTRTLLSQVRARSLPERVLLCKQGDH